MASTIKLNKADFASVCKQCEKAADSGDEVNLSLPGIGGNAKALEAYRYKAFELEYLVERYFDVLTQDVIALKSLGENLESADEGAAAAVGSGTR